MNGKKTVKKPVEKVKSCENCGAVMVKQDCIVCGAKKGKKQILEKEPQAKSRTVDIPKTPSDLYSQRNVARRFAWRFMLVAILAAISVFIYEYVNYQNLNNTYSSSGAILYEHDNNTLKIFMPNLNKALVLERYYKNTTDTIYAKNSSSGRFVAYLGNQQERNGGALGNLTLVDLTSIKDKGDSSSIKKSFASSELVIDFEFFNKSDTLIYLTQDNELYLCDFSRLSQLLPYRSGYDITLLDTGVTEILELKETVVIYTKENDSDNSTLSRIDISNNNYTIDNIDNNIIDVASTDKTITNIIYTKKGAGSGKLEAYLWKLGSGSERVVSEADEIVYSDAQSGEVFYLENSSMQIKLGEVFDDDLRLPDNELESILSRSEELIASEEYTIEEIEALEDELVLKETRDNLRAKIAKMVIELNNKEILCNLYYYSAKPNTRALVAQDLLLTNDNQKVKVDQDNSCLLFIDKRLSNFTPLEMSKLLPEDISKILAEDYTVDSLLSENIAENLVCYSATSGEFKNVFGARGTRTIANFDFNSENGTIHFLNYESYNMPVGTLYSAPYSQTSVGEVVYVDEYVSDVVGFYNGSVPGLIYQTASKDDLPIYSIYSYTNEGIFEIDYDTAPAKYAGIIKGKEDKFFYFKNYDTLTMSGELYELEVEAGLVDAHVEEYILLEDNIVVLQHQKKDDALKVIVGGHPVEIDKKVGAHTAFDSEFLPKIEN